MLPALLERTACTACTAALPQHSSSIDMALIPSYVSSTVTQQYSVAHQQSLLLGWAKRFKAFCVGLPGIKQAAIAAGDHNIFTAGACVDGALISTLQGEEWGAGWLQAFKHSAGHLSA